MPEPTSTQDPSALDASPASEPTSQPAPRVAARGTQAVLRSFIQAYGSALVPLGLLAAGVVFVMLGWYGAAHTNILTEQIPYLISGGLLGLGLIIVAGIMAVGARSDRETSALRTEIAKLAATANANSAPMGPAAFATNGHHVFTVRGGRSYHEPGCPILEGKEGVRELQPAAAVGAGLAPCKLCATD